MVCWINFGAQISKDFQNGPNQAKSNQIKPKQGQVFQLYFVVNQTCFERKSTNNTINITEPNDSKQLFRIRGARPEHPDTRSSRKRPTAYQNRFLLKKNVEGGSTPWKNRGSEETQQLLKKKLRLFDRFQYASEMAVFKHPQAPRRSEFKEIKDLDEI